MTKFIVGLFAAFAFTVAYAEAPASVTLKAKNGDVTFDHGKHKALDCTKCHADAKGGKIELGKDKAHALCLDCHKSEAAAGKAPTKCNDCHKKA